MKSMKQIISTIVGAVLLLSAAFSLSGCSTGDAAEPLDTEERTMTELEFYDVFLKHKPTEEEMLALQKRLNAGENIKFSEVVELIGRPHYGGITGLYSVNWETIEGSVYTVAFGLPAVSAAERGSTDWLIDRYGMALYVSQMYAAKEGGFFDSEMIHKPADADVERLEEGMAIYEVFEILGRPHRAIGSNTTIFYWETDAGNHIRVFPSSVRVGGFRSALWAYEVMDYVLTFDCSSVDPVDREAE